MVSAMSCRPKTFMSEASAREIISTIIMVTVTGKLRPPKRRGRVMPMRSAWRSRSSDSAMPGA